MKRHNSGSARFTGPKQKRIDFISQETREQNLDEYHNLAETVVSEIDDEEEFEQMNSRKGQLQGKL